MNRFSTLGFVIALAALPVAAQAQNSNDRYRQQVNAQLAVTSLLVAVDGYSEDQFFTSSLREGRSEYVTVNLRSSREYKIVGACDSDCRDLDLGFYNMAGSRLGYDYRRDAFPTITVPTGYSGTYRIKVDMESCSMDPCRYEFKVYSK